jgi:hypothetical protein
VKKFFLTFVILVIIAGALFFAGWAQLSVPVGSVAVIRSKTHGDSEKLIRAGEFQWLWYKLIPGNVSMAVFTIKPDSISIENHGSLPHAESYSELSGLQSDFSWEVGGTVSYSINEEKLPELIRQNSIEDQNSLLEYQQNISGDIKDYVLQCINVFFEQSAELVDDSRQTTGNSVIPDIANKIQAQFPLLGNISCYITIKKYPDFARYALSKELYQEYINRQKRILQGEVISRSDKHISSELRFRELAQYGELLTKYPILLEYLSIENKERSE